MRAQRLPGPCMHSFAQVHALHCLEALLRTLPPGAGALEGLPLQELFGLGLRAASVARFQAPGPSPRDTVRVQVRAHSCLHVFRQAACHKHIPAGRESKVEATTQHEWPLNPFDTFSSSLCRSMRSACSPRCSPWVPCPQGPTPLAQ